jgi:hypothetical protein
MDKETKQAIADCHTAISDMGHNLFLLTKDINNMKNVVAKLSDDLQKLDKLVKKEIYPIVNENCYSEK